MKNVSPGIFPFKRSNRLQGFGLAEVFIAIALCAILVALMLPVMQRLSARTRETHCVGNLNQWGRLFHLYLGENNGKFPLIQPYYDGRLWTSVDGPLFRLLYPDQAAQKAAWSQGKDINGCPGHSQLVFPSDRSLTYAYFSYAYNARLGSAGFTTASDFAERITDVVRPGRVVMIADALDYPNYTSVFYNASGLSFPHQGRANVLFVDGHVESISTLLTHHIYPKTQ